MIIINKLLSIILLSVVLFSCSSDDDDDDDDSGQGLSLLEEGLQYINAHESVDSRLEGKWKAFYTKYAWDVSYDFKKGEVHFNRENDITDLEGDEIIYDYCLYRSDMMFDYNEYTGEHVKYDTKGGYFIGTKPFIFAENLYYDEKYYKYKVVEDELTIEKVKWLKRSADNKVSGTTGYAITKYKRVGY